jgi:hypothetical protein
VRTRRSLAVLFVIVFVDLLGFGMVIPVMALYAERLGTPDSQIGWLMTGYSLMQFVFTPVWGRLSDRFGRRPLLLISIAMTALGFLGYALAPDFRWLLGSRIFAGAATANIAIAQAYIADVTPPEGRARGMGLIGAAFGLGFVLGPALGGLRSPPRTASRPCSSCPSPRRACHPRTGCASWRCSTSCAGRGSGVSSSSTCSLSSPSAAWRRPSRSSPRIATDSTSGT